MSLPKNFSVSVHRHEDTYIWFELSLHNVIGLLVDDLHGAVLVDLASKLTRLFGSDFGDGTTSGLCPNSDRLILRIE